MIVQSTYSRSLTMLQDYRMNHWSKKKTCESPAEPPICSDNDTDTGLGGMVGQMRLSRSHVYNRACSESLPSLSYWKMSTARFLVTTLALWMSGSSKAEWKSGDDGRLGFSPNLEDLYWNTSNPMQDDFDGLHLRYNLPNVEPFHSILVILE